MPSTSLRASRLTAVAAASGATNWLNRATWKLFDGNTLSPLVQSGATSMGWLFDQTGTFRARPHNLMTFSQDYTQAAWTKTRLTPSNVSDGFTKLVENFDTATTHDLVRLSLSWDAGKVYTVSMRVRAGERNIRLYLPTAAFGSAFSAVFNPTTGQATISVSGTVAGMSLEPDGQTWRCWITQTATTAASSGVTLRLVQGSSAISYDGDGSSGIFIGGVQVNEGELQPYYPTTGAAYYGPRVSYDPANLSLGPFLLAEEARTNLLLWNGDLSNAVWSKIAGTVQVDATVSPTGESNADKFIENTALAQHSVNQVVSATSSTYTVSVFVKAAERRRVFVRLDDAGSTNVRGYTFDVISGTVTAGVDGTTGTLTSSAAFITPAGNGWFRLGFTGVFSSQPASVRSLVYLATETNAVNYQGDGVSGAFIWGSQLEQVATASSPILTYGTAVTRSADNLSVTNLAATGFNASEGTIYIAGMTTAQTPIDKRMVSINDGTVGNNMGLHFGSASGGSLASIINTGGVFQYGPSEGAYAGGVIYKRALAYINGAPRAATNGVLALTSGAATTTVPSGLNRLELGHRLNNQHLDGRIYQAAIIPQRVPDSGLQRLTRI